MATSNASGPPSYSIIPAVIPSKRAKKRLTCKALLLPVEQLPVYPLPPLPTIDNPELAKDVFRHISLYDRSHHKFEESEFSPDRHYEKLEHVGDSILGMLVTTWLQEELPILTCGTATKLKAHLVSNSTLSHLSGLYGLPEKLCAPASMLPSLQIETDVRAALMEAYIAAIYFSHKPQDRIGIALPILDRWLREMYDPLLDFFHTHMKREHDQHLRAVEHDYDGNVIIMDRDELGKIDQMARGMALLVQMWGKSQEREIRWEVDKLFTEVGVLWRSKCTMDGIDMGEAVRADRTVAKDVSGWEAAKRLGLAVSAASLGFA